MGFEKITILGVGLIGASFALAMKKHALCTHVTGYGRTESNLIKAKERAIIDSYEMNAKKACEGSDLVVFATPVGKFTSLAAEIKESLKNGAIVIDVGSVKGDLLYEMEALMPDGVRFVGCHPIAGSERSGVDASTGELFNGALCVITRTEKSDDNAVEKIAEIWRTFGSIVEIMTPEEHDRIYGLVSHVPHLVAYALVNTVADIDASYLRFAGQGFKDTTRIASSSPDIWCDISLLNRENLLKFIELFKVNIDKLSLCLKTSDSECLREAFSKARALRESIEN